MTIFSSCTPNNFWRLTFSTYLRWLSGLLYTECDLCRYIWILSQYFICYMHVYNEKCSIKLTVKPHEVCLRVSLSYTDWAFDGLTFYFPAWSTLLRSSIRLLWLIFLLLQCIAHDEGLASWLGDCVRLWKTISTYPCKSRSPIHIFFSLEQMESSSTSTSE